MTFDLDQRTGWPPDFRFLLERYPRAVWPTHANLGELSRFWLAIHGNFRELGSALQTAALAYREGEVPAAEFSLTRLVGDRPHRAAPAGPEIVLVTEGVATLVAESGGEPVELGPGQAAFVAWSDGPYRIEPRRAGLWWRVGIGSTVGDSQLLA